MKKACLALLFGLMATAPLAAAPTWLGHSGLLLTPTADAISSGEWNVAFHHITDNSNIFVGNIGVAPGLEVGAVFFDPQGSRGKSKWTGQAKYRILNETNRVVGLAVGWWDPFDEIDSTPYGVVSKRITNVGGRPLRGHVGVGGGVFDSVFVGADWPVTEQLLLMGEFDGDDVNFGGRVGLPGGLRLDVGMVSSEFGIGASYNAKF